MKVIVQKLRKDCLKQNELLNVGLLQGAVMFVSSISFNLHLLFRTEEIVCAIDKSDDEKHDRPNNQFLVDTFPYTGFPTK